MGLLTKGLQASAGAGLPGVYSESGGLFVSIY